MTSFRAPEQSTYKSASDPQMGKGCVPREEAVGQTDQILNLGKSASEM